MGVNGKDRVCVVFLRETLANVGNVSAISHLAWQLRRAHEARYKG